MLQQRMRQADIALHDVCIAPGRSVGDSSQSQQQQSTAAEAHAFNASTDPVAVLLASYPCQTGSGTQPTQAQGHGQAHYAILTSLVLQRQGIEVQASSEVGSQIWNVTEQAPQQLHAMPGRGGDSALLWQLHGPAALWSLLSGTSFPAPAYMLCLPRYMLCTKLTCLPPPPPPPHGTPTGLGPSLLVPCKS